MIKMKLSSTLLRLSTVFVIMGVVSNALAQIDSAAGTKAREGESSAAASPADSSVLSDLDQSINEIARRVLPAIVQIEVSGYGPREHGGVSQVIEKQRAIGSGVIVDPSGYIMTNNHVVEGAQRIRVVLSPATLELVPFKTSLLVRQRTYDAKLLGVERQGDLALIKIEEKGLPYIPLQENFTVRLGQTVLAVGSPEGLTHSVTHGIVSAVGRQPDPDRPMVYIQTDAPINPGNSGGALVDRNGNLVGINTFIFTEGGGSEGLGFAIPEPAVRFVYRELKDHGRVRKTVIGANAQTITPTLAAALKLPQDWGVIISDVTPGGPADKAGVKAKDIVVAMDSRMIDSLPKFAASLYLHDRSQPVQMDVLRGTDAAKLYIPALEAHAGIDSLADLIDPQTGLISSLGVFVVDLNKQVADMLPDLRSQSGVIVAGKVGYEPAIDADLSVGDVIRSFNGRSLENAAGLRQELKALKPGAPVVLEVERLGVIQFVAFEME
jgi:serine protease Do